MIKLEKILLQNYCGYENFEIDLVDNDGKTKKWQIFYGPNGIGKSNFIRAVDYLSSPRRFLGRHGENSLIFRKLKYHPDYIAGAETLVEDVADLNMEAVFKKDGESFSRDVIIRDNIKGPLTHKNRTNSKWISGVVKNDLPENVISVALYIDADNPSNMSSFQLPVSLKSSFLDFAESVYGFGVSLPDNSIVEDGDSTGLYYYTDIILEKKNRKSCKSCKVHFKRFSDGEKKIATLLSALFRKAYNKNEDENSIILIDNIEMHIYFKRHLILIDKMNEFFPYHQILATTHSPIIVKNMEKKYLVDLEEFI